MQPKPNDKNTIYSTEKSSHWVMMAIGLIFILVILINYDDYLSGVNINDFSTLFVFIFPIIGVVLIYKGITARQQFLSVGRMPLNLSPHIGQIGGQIGGEIFYNHPWKKRQCLLTLSCFHTFKEGHGEDDSSQTKLIWQTDCIPFEKPSQNGSVFEFSFDVDGDLPTNDSLMTDGSVRWTLTLESKHNDNKFTRNWTIPVEKGEELSSISIPDEHKWDEAQQKQTNANESIHQQINITKNNNELYLESSAGRIKKISIPMIIIGVIATVVSIYLSTKILHGASVRSDMAPILTIAGLLITGYGLFLNNRQLECKIIGQTVYVRRKIFGKIIYKHQGILNSAKQLKLKEVWSSQLGNKKVDYMTITAKVVCDDAKSRHLKLVESIEGRLAGEAMQQKIVDFIS